MTIHEPLLIKGPDGWRWGPWKGSTNATTCCVISRALDRYVGNPTAMAYETSLGRLLTGEEFSAIASIDCEQGTDEDRDVVLLLARAMGVDP